MSKVPSEPRSERLFDAEATLRFRARQYAAEAIDGTRKRLREAAIEYAKVASDVDAEARRG